MIFRRRNLLERPPGHHAVRRSLGDPRHILMLLVLVMLLNQQPVRFGLMRRLAAHADQRPLAVHLLAMHDDFQTPRPQPLIHIRMPGLRFPCALVPEQHRPAAILALGDGPFKAAILHGMVFHLDRQALVMHDIARPLGHGPALEHAVPAEAKVIVQASGCMLLDDKRKLAEGRSSTRCIASRLGRRPEVAHSPIAGQLLVHGF